MNTHNRYIHKLLYALAFAFGCSIGLSQVSHDLTMKVFDENGQPLAGARATITFLGIKGESLNEGLTDRNGEFHASTKMSLETSLQAKMSGHYSAMVCNSPRYRIPYDQKATIPIVLPRIINPIPLYSLRISLNLPVQNEWVGYDFEVADWVPPHGNGKTADIRFKYRNEFMGYLDVDNNSLERTREMSRIRFQQTGRVLTEDEFKLSAGKWRGELEVSFPGAKEGVMEETARYWHYGELRLPHQAPAEGYQPGLQFTANTYEPRQPPKLIGYYLRTRVKLDADGNIIFANYAKIYDEIRFDARGTVAIWYYFNPRPNDRNLEFNPMRNLFPNSRSGSNIANP